MSEYCFWIHGSMVNCWFCDLENQEILFEKLCNSQCKIFITIFDVNLVSNIFFKFGIMKYEKKKKNNKYEFVVHTYVYPKDLEK